MAHTLVLLLVGTAASFSATRTWNGAATNNNLWSNQTNWGGNAPNGGDSLVFAGTVRLNTTNDFTYLSAAGTNVSFLFQTNAGAFILNGNQMALTGGITNLSANHQTINLAITLAGTNTIAATSNSIVINGVISGTNGLIKTGAATLVLNATNTYTGGTTVSAGTLQIGASEVLANTGAVTVSGGTFDIGSFSDSVGIVTLTSGTITGTTGVLTGTSYAMSGTDAVSAILGGTGALTKTGSGTTTTLSGANSYTGTTTVTTGVLNIQNATGLGTTAGGTSVANGAALELQGGISIGVEALTLNGTGVSSGGALRNISGNNTYGGLITLGRASRINSDSGTLSLTNTGTITGATLSLTVGGAGDTALNSIIGTTSGTLTKDGAGKLTLSGTNTYTGGTTISGGTLAISSSRNLGVLTNTLTLAGGGRLQVTSSLTNNRSITVTTGNVATISADVGVTNTMGGTINKDGSDLILGGGGTHFINGTILGASANSDLYISNSVATLYATNSYSGPTFVVAGGTLNNGIANALPIAADLILGQTNETSSTTNRYNLGGYSQTVASVTAAGSSVNVVTNSTGSGTLTLNSATDKTISGLTVGGSGLTLAKTNSNTVTLSGGNSIRPVTIAIQQGTLLLGAANQIGDTTGITMSGGTLDTAGYGDSVGKLTVSAASTIQGMNTTVGTNFLFSDVDLSSYATSSGSALTFVGSGGNYLVGNVINLSSANSTAWTGYSTTSLNNFADKISFNDATLRASISFNGTNTQLTVAAVPEARVWVGAGMLILLIGLVEIRRRRPAAQRVELDKKD